MREARDAVGVDQRLVAHQDVAREELLRNLQRALVLAVFEEVLGPPQALLGARSSVGGEGRGDAEEQRELTYAVQQPPQGGASSLLATAGKACRGARIRCPARTSTS